MAGLVFTAAWLAAGAASQANPAWVAPDAAKKAVNPVKSTPQAHAAARKIYVETCEQCHGEKGKGDGIEAMMYSVKPADLSDAKKLDAATDGELFYKITEGRRPMPGFRNSLSEEQRWQMVHFVRTLSKPAPARKAKPAKQAPP